MPLPSFLVYLLLSLGLCLVLTSADLTPEPADTELSFIANSFSIEASTFNLSSDVLTAKDTNLLVSLPHPLVRVSLNLPQQQNISACFLKSLSPTADLVFPTAFDLKNPFNTTTRYNALRRGTNSRSLDFFPAVIVSVVQEKDIRAAVMCARSLNLSLNVMAGGHSYAVGYATEGILLHLTRYNNVTTNLTTTPATVTAQAGARLARVYGVILRDGLNSSKGPVYTMSTGTDESVGLCGHAMCGGFGRYGRYLGYAAEQIDAFTVVDYRGVVLTVSASQNADLFWALRGGCSTAFGVVSTITLRLYDTGPVGNVTHISFTVPPALTGAALAWAAQNGPFLDDRCSVVFNLDKGNIVCVFLGLRDQAVAATWQTPGANFSSLAALLGYLPNVSPNKFYHPKSLVESLQGAFGMPVAQMVAHVNEDFWGSRTYMMDTMFTTVPPAFILNEMAALSLNNTVTSVALKARNGLNHRNTGPGGQGGPMFVDDRFGPLVRGALFELHIGMSISSRATPAMVNATVNLLLQLRSRWQPYLAGDSAYIGYGFWPFRSESYFGADNVRKLQYMRRLWDPKNVFTSVAARQMYPVRADFAADEC